MRARWAARCFDVGACLAIAWLALLIASFGYGRDQGIYAVVARAIGDGGAPYRDAWDFKPPGIYFVYALARELFGAAPWAVRALEVGGLAATVLALVRLAERWWGDRRLGLAAGVLAALAHAQLDFWHSAQPESFAGMLIAIAVEHGTRPGRRAPLGLFVAGVLFGCAGLLKPPLALGGAVVAFACTIARWRRGERRARVLAPCALVLLGGILPALACVAWFASRGAIEPLRATLFEYAPRYTALGWHEASVLGLLRKAGAEWLLGGSSAVTAGLLFALPRARRLLRARGVVLVLAIVATQLAGVALQAKFFTYHYAACWPLTALLAALGWRTLWRTLPRHALGAIAFALVLVVAIAARPVARDLPQSFWWRARERTILLLAGSRSHERFDALASVVDVDAARNRRLADAIRSHTRPGEPLYVWGFEPTLYLLSERPLASRYLYNVPQRTPWSATPARSELLAELHAHPPAAIVVTVGDAFPWVTGNDHDSSTALATFPDLAALIARDYALAQTVDGYGLYLRR